MKQILIFIGGMLTGALILYAIGFRSESSLKEQLAQELIQKLSNNLTDQDTEVQYLEVNGKKGNVMVHTGMTKDSVRILVGKPDKVEIRPFNFSTLEEWGYKIKSNYRTDLEISFEAGKLISLRQN